MACGIVSFDGIYQSNEWIFYKLLCYGLRVKCSLTGVCFECSVPSLGTWLFESPGAIRRYVLAGGGRLLGDGAFEGYTSPGVTLPFLLAYYNTRGL